MPTRKQLIDQARADQRARSARARADNPKSAIVGIGDRDPLTGQYQVLLPNGSVETGEKQFNSSLPKGSQVLGVPQSTGGWLLDERDVQPIKPISPTSPMGNIKILYSQIEGNLRVFYLWGDRAAPKKIGSIPSYAYTPSNTSDWLISNRGKGDKFIVAIAWAVTNGATKFQSFGANTWTYGITEAFMSYGNHISLGHGYWVDFYNLIDAPTGSYFPPYDQPYQTMLNKGAVTTYSGSRVVTPYTTSDNTIDVDTTTDTRSVPVLPSITRPNYAFAVRNYLARDGVFYLPLCIDKNAQFAICRRQEKSNYILQPFTNLLISANLEIIIGGVPPLSYDRGNLIGQKFYRVNTNSPTDSQWQVDIYKLSANTTKKTIKERVQYKHSPNYTIHSASYHP